MRVVLDTNIFVSAFFWNGNERRVLKSCKKKKHQLITSPQILDELSRVLLSKFDVPKDMVMDFQEELLLMSELVVPAGGLKTILEDPSDNIVLETAELGKADKIITGDRHLLRLKRYKDIQIRQSANL